MNSTYRQIYRKAKEMENGITRFLLDLLAVPSHSGKEKEVVERIATEMKQLDFDEARIDGLGNVIGRIGRGKRVLAFDAHVDTVYAGDLSQWSFPPFQPKIEAGRIWGRGAADQKSGLASMVYAGKLIRELELADTLTLLFIGSVMEEDCEGLCWHYLVEKEGIKPDLVVITEPTNLNIYRGHRGRMEIQVEIKGRSCHGSAPERGDNAAYKISRIALEIEKLNGRLKTDPFLGKGSVTVSEVASSSPSLCAVPDSARLYLDRRLTFGETKENALAEVTQAARDAGYGDARVTVPEYRQPSHTGLVFPFEKYFPTWTLDAESPYLQQAIAAYQGLFERQPLVDKWTFSTNGVGIVPVYDIPCLGLGPGDEVQAHAVDESCPITQLSAATAFYAALAAKLTMKEVEKRVRR